MRALVAHHHRTDSQPLCAPQTQALQKLALQKPVVVIAAERIGAARLRRGQFESTAHPARTLVLRGAPGERALEFFVIDRSSGATSYAHRLDAQRFPSITRTST